MLMYRTNKKNNAFAFILSVTTCLHVSFADARLKSLNDSDMSNIAGQAYLAVDQQSHASALGNTSFTRISMGLDIDIQTNIETLELGRYERNDDPYGERKESDVLVRNFSLGQIYDSAYYDRNPNAARPLKEDGSSYSNGEIVPFKIQDPFIEFAFDDDTNQVIGARIGFGRSQGMLSGDIDTLTGNVNVDILDRGEGMKSASSSGTLGDKLVVLLTPLLEGNSPLQTQAQLVDSAGHLDPIRSTMIGVPNGEKFTLSGASGFTRWSLKNLLGWSLSSDIEVPNCSFFSCPGGDIYISVNDCEVLGVQACFNLSDYGSFPIGDIQEVGGKRYLVGPSDGMFLSFQTKDLEWLKDVRKDNPSAVDFVQATKGAFFNIPNGVVEVNLSEALNGTERVRTEYIDRGKGLF